MSFWDEFLDESKEKKKKEEQRIIEFKSRAEAIDLEPLKPLKPIKKIEVEEEKKIEQKKSSPEPKKNIDLSIEPLIQPKKLIISSDLDLLSKSLEQTVGFDISNVNISQDDLWLLYRLKFGKGTRVKRSVLLPQFTEAFNRNLEKMKK